MRFFLRRFAFYVFTAWAAVTINFFIPRLIPGDPVSALVSNMRGQITTDQIQSLTVLFGLDKHEGLWSQYVHYLEQLARGDLGISFGNFPLPVSTVLGQALPWTLALIGITTILSFAIGTALGVFAGWRRGLSSLTVPARPPRRSAPRRSESYFEDGLMKRELHRL